MTHSPAPSTPRPLPRKREQAEKRPRLALAGNAPARVSGVDSNDGGLTPAIQTNEAPFARRKPVQTNEATSDSRRGHLERVDTLRAQIRLLVEQISLAADVELLDLMRDEVGSYSRHKAAQDARTWAATAGVTLETGLMQLERALQSTSPEAHHG
ncbi:hypothetical protein QYH69_29520 [Paraburkholderia sp. SARCC-3016]|uniref:hypothetical protein n=1 Tax=Paraburkholderia sp. SARCC-3016 TaxID=3058611 RepID=UPI002806B291|nr:hypothetical protein [Paraburkholderia sp. SARCC-3016]MDQ7981376.1 hypothetical protein [Paraburkholderia sp. SARCC-3016]